MLEFAKEIDARKYEMDFTIVRVYSKNRDGEIIKGWNCPRLSIF